MSRTKARKAEIAQAQAAGVEPPPAQYRFKPGNTAAVGNPGPGRTKILSQQLTSILNEEYVRQVNEGSAERPRMVMKKQGITKLRRMLDQLVFNACEGDTHAIKEVYDRLEGKAPQAIAIEDPEGVLAPRFYLVVDGKPIEHLNRQAPEMKLVGGAKT